MSLLKLIDDDLRLAMKSSDTVRVSALRMAKAAIKNYQIEKRMELSDDEIRQVLMPEVRGVADGKRVNERVRELLSSLRRQV